MIKRPFLSRHRTDRRLVLLVPGLLVGAMAAPLSGNRAQAGQAPRASDACALLTADEIQAVAPRDDVGAGVASASPSLDSVSCRYAWGIGTGRHALAISVGAAPRMFGGAGPDAIRQGLASQIVPGTSDRTVADVGEAAVFKSYSAAYVGASAYVKGRILQITLDGYDARDKAEQVISLLKSAASRL